MNRGEIRDEIRRLIKDTDTSNPRWSDATLNKRIDLSHETISSRTRCVSYRYTTNIVNGQAEYAMSDNFLEASIVMILQDGDSKAIVKQSEQQMDSLNPSWRNDSGTPSNWYQRINYIGLTPKPDYSLTSGLIIDQIITPALMTADADIPFDSIKEMYPFHKVLCYDVALSCAMDDGSDTKYALFSKEVTDFISKMIAQVNSKTSETRIPNIYESLRARSRR